MHCGLGSQQRSLQSHAEKYGSWSRIPESANGDKPDTILAFYCIDPFPQTHKANSNYWFMFRIIAVSSWATVRSRFKVTLFNNYEARGRFFLEVEKLY